MARKSENRNHSMDPKQLTEILKQLSDHERRLRNLEGARAAGSPAEEASGATGVSPGEFHNSRAYLKKHAKGLSGAKKFVLVVACLAKGVAGEKISSGAVTDLWGSLTGVLGKYNGAYATRATETGWVNSPPRKQGYSLGNNWRQVLSD